MMHSKLNRLDRGAVFRSTFRQGQAAVGGERDHRRSMGKRPGFPLLGRQIRSAGLSQSICEALSMTIRNVRLTVAVTRYYMDRLTKRFIFIYHPVRQGDESRNDPNGSERGTK